MMRRRYVVVMALTIALLLLPGHAAADVNDFDITDFQAAYTLSKADPHGQLRVVEHISVDFTDNNHGLLRTLPEQYKGMPLDLHVNDVTSDSGAPSTYTVTSDGNGNDVIKIGDPSRTVTGAQEYTIDYTLDNVI